MYNYKYQEFLISKALYTYLSRCAQVGTHLGLYLAGAQFEFWWEHLTISVDRVSAFSQLLQAKAGIVEPSWNVMAHGDAWVGKLRGNWQMEWVASTLHTTSELGVSSITTADAHASAASSRLNWRPCQFKWTSPFHRKKKSGFCACAITFQTQSTTFRSCLLYILFGSLISNY